MTVAVTLTSCLGSESDVDPRMQSCSAGQLTCGGACTDVKTSAQHCGACGNACGAGQACINGQCGGSCDSGKRQCGGACVDLFSDAANCGTCGNVCTKGLVCKRGSCDCPGTTEQQCGGACVDTDNDPKNCGACGNLCAGQQQCVFGSCVCGVSSHEMECSDSRDDDCDTRIDCDDADCVGKKRACTLANKKPGYQMCMQDGWSDCQEGSASDPLTDVPEPLPSDCQATILDEAEPNETCAQASVFSPQVSPRNVTIHGAFINEKDRYDAYVIHYNDDERWCWPKGDHISVRLSSIPAGEDYDLHVFPTKAAAQACAHPTQYANGRDWVYSINSGNMDERIEWAETCDGFFKNTAGALSIYDIYVVVFRKKGAPSCAHPYRLDISVNGS